MGKVTGKYKGKAKFSLPFIFSSKSDFYSPGCIASEGQTSAHVPHSVHASGLIEYLSPSEIAPTGHSSMQVPQAMQSSLIT